MVGKGQSGILLTSKDLMMVAPCCALREAVAMPARRVADSLSAREMRGRTGSARVALQAAGARPGWSGRGPLVARCGNERCFAAAIRTLFAGSTSRGVAWGPLFASREDWHGELRIVSIVSPDPTLGTCERGEALAGARQARAARVEHGGTIAARPSGSNGS